MSKDRPNAPFLCWECLTIELANGRTIDLVIKDEKDMMKLIKYLIWKLDTINNQTKNSSKVIEALAKEKLKSEQKAKPYALGEKRQWEI